MEIPHSATLLSTSTVSKAFVTPANGLLFFMASCITVNTPWNFSQRSDSNQVHFCDNPLAPPLFLIDLYINRLYRSHNALFPLTRPFSDNSFSSSRSFVLCNRLFGGLWLGTAVFSKLGSVSHIAFFVIFYHPGTFSPMFQIPTSTFI